MLAAPAYLDYPALQHLLVLPLDHGQRQIPVDVQLHRQVYVTILPNVRKLLLYIGALTREGAWTRSYYLVVVYVQTKLVEAHHAAPSSGTLAG